MRAYRKVLILHQWYSTAVTSGGRHSGVNLVSDSLSCPGQVYSMYNAGTEASGVNHSAGVNPREGHQFRKCHSEQKGSCGFSIGWVAPKCSQSVHMCYNSSAMPVQCLLGGTFPSREIHVWCLWRTLPLLWERLPSPL